MSWMTIESGFHYKNKNSFTYVDVSLMMEKP